MSTPPPFEVCSKCGGAAEKCQERRCWGWVNGQRMFYDGSPAALEAALASKAPSPAHAGEWSASVPYNLTGTFVAYIKEGDKTVLQTRCSSHEEADRIARLVVESVNGRSTPSASAPVEVTEDLVRSTMAEAFSLSAMSEPGWSPQRAMTRALTAALKRKES